MKQRLFILILYLIVILYFFVFSFSGALLAEEKEELEKRIQNCISCCADKKQGCFNVMVDRRLCEAVFQDCVANCKSEGNHYAEWSDCWDRSRE